MDIAPQMMAYALAQNGQSGAGNGIDVPDRTMDIKFRTHIRRPFDLSVTDIVGENDTVSYKEVTVWPGVIYTGTHMVRAKRADSLKFKPCDDPLMEQGVPENGIFLVLGYDTAYTAEIRALKQPLALMNIPLFLMDRAGVIYDYRSAMYLPLYA